MKIANGMLILAFGILGSYSQSPTTIEVTPNESPTMTHSTIIHAQNVMTRRYLKVTSKSEKTSNSGKSGRTTNSAKSSKSENRKPETKKKPPSIAPPLEINETTNKPKQCPVIPRPCVKKPRPCSVPVPPNNKIVTPPNPTKDEYSPPTKDEYSPPTKDEKDCRSGKCGVWKPNCSKSKSGKSNCSNNQPSCSNSKSGKSSCGDYQPSCSKSKSGKSSCGDDQAWWDGPVRKLGKEAWEADSASGGENRPVIVYSEDIHCYIIDSVCPCIDIEQVSCPPFQPKKKPVLCKGDGTSGCTKSPTKKHVVKPTASPVIIVEIENSMSMSMSPSESPSTAFPTTHFLTISTALSQPVTEAPSTTAPTCHDGETKSGKAWYGETKSGKAWYGEGQDKSGKIFKYGKTESAKTKSAKATSRIPTFFPSAVATSFPSVFVTQAIGPIERAPLSYWAGEWEPKNRRQLERRRLV